MESHGPLILPRSQFGGPVTQAWEEKGCGGVGECQGVFSRVTGLGVGDT